jgi:hypothetical protein
LRHHWRGQQVSDLIHKLGPAGDQAAAHVMQALQILLSD